jgi:hypothetical protein
VPAWQIERAIGDGFDVRGLMVWTLIDNFEARALMLPACAVPPAAAHAQLHSMAAALLCADTCQRHALQACQPAGAHVWQT